MSEYIVSARKYRPTTFESVIGQVALTTTLKNAISTGKLAHAYLFCGPRGVGKTTCARIFAKTINCLSPTDKGEACNQCESCVAFNEQRSYNIHELDAASNNSVEDIRSLIEQVRIPPQVGRYKVFIIDEVHMLSTAAFNAFLKTLEEPPTHVIFILATTEKHKILPTILSRCQIYDFNRMEVTDIINHLKNVALQEGIGYEESALNIIAQKADGGMRDALSIFDQLASFTGGNITYNQTIENLNVLDYEYYFQLTNDFLNRNISNILLTFNEILRKGFEGGHFINGLASHFRDLLICKDEATLSLLEVAGSVRQRYLEQAKLCSTEFIYQALKLCNSCDMNYRASKNKRLLIELTLIEIAQCLGETQTATPQKRLKSLFKQPETHAPKQTVPPVSSQSVHSPTPPHTQTVQPAHPTGNDPSFQPNASKELSTSQNVTLCSSLPRLKKIGTTSIKIQTQQDKSNETSPVSTTSTKANILKKEYFDEKDLHYYWYQYANQLPQEKSATAGRMKIMIPKLLEDATFEVTVDNDLVENDLQRLAPEIEKFLQEKLNNETIKMFIRVTQTKEQTRAYSKKEQFNLMAQKNPSLTKLQERFGLDLI